MKAVIFAGGVGTRLWPLSRKRSPKQFEKVIGDKSTLQFAVERLFPDFSWEDIFISTGISYVPLVVKQLPQVPHNQIIGEPQMRDVGPAVGLMTSILVKTSPRTPCIILWSDHIVKNEILFRRIITLAASLVEKDPKKIVFISQKPRFASQNLGWIEFGAPVKTVDEVKIHQFKSFKYRPTREVAERFFKSTHHAWNVGYFVTTPSFLWEQYKRLVPETYGKLKHIQEAWGTHHFEATLTRIYPTIEKAHFDNAILEKLDPKDAYVISEDMQWSDIGAWEALKEALQKDPTQNVIKGKVLTEGTSDSLIYNFADQTVVAIDVKEYVVINTHDVVLICHKNSVPKIKKLVENFSGTKNEHLI